jgi:hypothetical protein
MDILETARLLRFQSAWERRFHQYELLLIAGVDAEEAERIVRRTAADRAEAEQKEAA